MRRWVWGLLAPVFVMPAVRSPAQVEERITLLNGHGCCANEVGRLADRCNDIAMARPYWPAAMAKTIDR
jgi:hypothetical protein